RSLVKQYAYSVTIQLTDEIGYWDAPKADGDLLVQLTWRGLGSNRVRLGLGQIGGGPADDDGAKPTPFGTRLQTISKENPPAGGPDHAHYRWPRDRLRSLRQAASGP